MSDYDLIPEEAYENLPEDSNEKFVTLVRIAQANLGRLLDSTQSGDYTVELRAQFISIVAGIAEALDVAGLPSVDSNSLDYTAYQTFQVYLAGVIAKVRLQSGVLSKPHSVELGRITKARIKQEIDQLRFAIEQSDLPISTRRSLGDKLDELEAELSKKRLGFAKTMAILASIAGIGGGATATLANSPKAAETISTIIRLVGEDKQKEEQERLRLAPPPKPLPDLRPKQSGFAEDLDDDVPF